MEYTAGRELDVLIAEKAMGWIPLVGVEAIASFEGNPELTDPKRWHRKKIWVKDGVKVGCEECGTMPNYSTSIADAWNVVEQLTVLDFGFALFKYPGISSAGWGHVAVFAKSLRPYSIEIVNLGDPTKVFHGHDDAAPLAICLAALRAVECI